MRAYDVDIYEGADDFAIANAGGSYTEAGSQHTPFGAIVMRPGLNVQLRCGYSNDPEMLEVMLSGRVTDISWSQLGDLCEITVQSFGAELTRIRKGINMAYGANQKRLIEGYEEDKSKDDWTFPTTHHLLGSLMLSPELEHFGRWEHGQLFQLGEAKDASLDFYDYSRKSPFGLDSVDIMTKWVQNNWAVAIGVSALLDISMFVSPAGLLRLPFVAAGKFGTQAAVQAARLGGVIGKIGWKGYDLAALGTKMVGVASKGISRMKAGSWLASNALATIGARATAGRFVPWMATLRYGRGKAYIMRSLLGPQMERYINFFN